MSRDILGCHHWGWGCDRYLVHRGKDESGNMKTSYFLRILQAQSAPEHRSQNLEERGEEEAPLWMSFHLSILLEVKGMVQTTRHRSIKWREREKVQWSSGLWTLWLPLSRCVMRREGPPGTGVTLFTWSPSFLWRRERQPTAVFLPGESHGERSLVGYSLQSCKE